MTRALSIAVLVAALGKLAPAQAQSLAGFPGDLTIVPVAFAKGTPNVKPQPVRLANLTDRVTMIGFISALCPISNEYIDRMNALYRQFSGRPGVSLVFLYPNSNEPADVVASHARGAGFIFPVYRDVGAVVADALAARHTPEFFVVAENATVLYRGAFDDARNPARVKVRAVEAVLQAAVEGKTPIVQSVRALGCAIHRPIKNR